jgi:hypothetical protein
LPGKRERKRKRERERGREGERERNKGRERDSERERKRREREREKGERESGERRESISPQYRQLHEVRYCVQGKRGGRSISQKKGKKETPDVKDCRLDYLYGQLHSAIYSPISEK